MARSFIGSAFARGFTSSLSVSAVSSVQAGDVTGPKGGTGDPGAPSSPTLHQLWLEI